MQFGITIKPDMTVERIVALTRQAGGGWLRSTDGFSIRTCFGSSRIPCSR